MKTQNNNKKMNGVKLVGERLRLACCFFTVAMLLSFVFNKKNNGASNLYIYSSLAFSVCLAFIQLVMKIKNVSYIIRLFLHMVLTYIVFTVIFFVVNSRGPAGQAVFTPTTYAVLAITIAVIYGLLGSIGFAYSRRVKRQADEDKYKNQFS